MSKTKRHPCEVCITRPHGGPDGEDVTIQVTDESSGVRFLEVYMSHTEFSRALGSSIGVGMAELRWTHNVGMKHEHKTEYVPFAYGDKDKDGALAPFEVDGWKGSRSDLGNHHRGVHDGYSVGFHRFVDPETGEPTP